MENRNNGLAVRAGRILLALMLTFSLSLSTAMAAADSGSSSSQSSQSATSSQAETGAQSSKEGIKTIKGALYYSDAKGAIRKTAGFFKYDGKLYYSQKGGKLESGRTFKIGKKQYRAYKDGHIATGVYKWGGKYYYSDPKSGQWIKSAKFVKWKDKSYYIQKGGVIATGKPFVVKNLPYEANARGESKRIEIIKPGNNKVLSIAQKQVGNMTGKKYWRWYFGTRFIDTDRTPWCGTFVAWCYKQAGKYSKISGIKRYGNLGYVPSYSKFANRKNKWVKKANAKGGDIIVFGRNRHVGIVERVYNGYVFTIEGNSGPTSKIGSKKPGAVTRKVYKLTDKDIKGVIRAF